MEWNDIKVKDILRIREICSQSIDEDEKDLRVGAYLNGYEYDDFINLPMSKTEELMKVVSFLYDKPEKVKARRVYEINGRRYRLFKNTEDMTTAQFIDFQAISKEGFEKMPAEMLSIFLVPEGHTYNDGYDKEEVINDMRDMKVTEALGVADFFTKRFKRLMMRSLTFSEAMVTAQRIMARKEDKERMRAIELEVKLIGDELRSMYGYLL